jgi:hypothetical protein
MKAYFSMFRNFWDIERSVWSSQFTLKMNNIFNVPDHLEHLSDVQQNLVRRQIHSHGDKNKFTMSQIGDGIGRCAKGVVR